VGYASFLGTFALFYRCCSTEVPQSRLNAAEDVSVTTEASASLNRSYDTATAGRRTRSAAATARAAERRRIRTASSTSSVPAATSETSGDAGRKMAAQDGGGPVSNTLGLFASLHGCASSIEVNDPSDFRNYQ